MPISPIVLQRRHAELGRIRLGDKGDRGQPQKLSQFRFTSPSEAYIKDLAELYGGTPQHWDNNGKPEWEVYTTADSIPVYAVKGGLSQWLEYWQGGGIVHRCDGETNVLTGEPCDHTEKVKTRVRGQDVWVNPHEEAKPTTRLSVMLPELDAIGVWRMESKGWNAAAEIPAVAELAAYVGDYAPAVLHLVERRVVKDGRTSRFVVPVLDLRIGQARLREVVAAVSGGAAEVAAPAQAAAIEAPKQEQPPARQQVKIPTPEQIQSFDLDTARKALAYLDRHAPTHPARDAVYDRVADLEPSPDADGAVDAVVVEQPVVEQPAQDVEAAATEADIVWQQILAEGGRLGMSLDDCTDGYARFSGGLLATDASVAELEQYLQALRAGEQVSA